MPPTPELKLHTGVKILNLDFMGFSDILGVAPGLGLSGSGVRNLSFMMVWDRY